MNIKEQKGGGRKLNINRTAFRLESIACLLFDIQIAAETVWDFI